VMCPFCNQLMEHGKIYGEGGHGVYWMPIKHNECDFYFLNKRAVEKADGIVLDKLSKIGFFAKSRPISHYCKPCDLFITKNAHP